MKITHFIIVICLGLVLPSQAQDCSKPVPGANMVLSESDIRLSTFPSGYRATFVCSTGYTSAGGSGAVTCNAGSWSAATLKCQKKTCGSPGEVENGDIDFPTGNEFGDKLVVKCRPGHTLVGQSEILCGDQGWMGRLPTCEVVTCDEPSQITDGSFSPVKDPYNYLDVVTYSCSKGLTVNGSQTVTCSEDGTFEPGPPKCIKVECADPKVDNGEWVSGSRPPHKYQATVTYRCNAGYKMEGEPTLECDINSQWTPGIPKCTEVTCGPPPAIVNGAFSPQKGSYRYLEKVEFSCQQGFILSGSNSASCSSDGTFKGPPPTCREVVCAEPEVDNAELVSGSHPSYKPQAKVTFRCNAGYRMEGEPTLECGINGQWTPGIPKCTEVVCAEPEVDNAELVSGSHPSYKPQAKVTFRCNAGYRMEGEPTLECDINGQWTPEIPKCSVVTCSPPPKIANGDFRPQKKFYQYSEDVEYTCIKDFILNGSKKITCSSDGNFKAAPTCYYNVTPTPISTIVGAVLGSFAVLAVVLIAFYFCNKRKSKEGRQGEKPEEEISF